MCEARFLSNIDAILGDDLGNDCDTFGLRESTHINADSGQMENPHFFPRHARGPALNDKRLSLGQFFAMNRDGLNWSGSSQ